MFMIMVKLLHETCHLLTNSFFKYCGLDVSEGEYKDTPKIGTTYAKGKYIGDCGFGMEEYAFGGRFVSGSLGGPMPYDDKLQAVQVNENDNSYYKVSDDYVRRVLNFFSGDEVSKFNLHCIGMEW
jgi:hypothetical protein